jgi:hypothetical protein
MAQIFRHPEVEDYFHTLDFNQPIASLTSEAIGLYESAQVFLLKNARVDCDREFLASLQFANITASKKFKSLDFSKRYLAHRREKISVEFYDELLKSTFGGDRSRMDYFAEQVESINSQVAVINERVFSSYRVARPSITWRLTETINENLHIDVYNEDFPEHHLRLFVNLDVVPRIWHTSHTLEHLLQTSLNLLPEEFVRTASPGRICHALNFAVFKGFPEAGREGSPKHIIFFEPGEIWAVDSRKVSHQIFFGRKALSTEHVIERSSMTNPAAHYFDIVNRYREAHLLSSQRALASPESASTYKP